MITHWQGIEALLQPLGYTVFRGYADKGSGQYVVISSNAFDNPDEPTLGPTSAFNTDVRVKAVTGTIDGVVIMLDRIRAALWPSNAAAPLTVANRNAWIAYERSEFIDVDESTTIPGTNRHPAFGVDTYRLSSEPI